MSEKRTLVFLGVTFVLMLLGCLLPGKFAGPISLGIWMAVGSVTVIIYHIVQRKSLSRKNAFDPNAKPIWNDGLFVWPTAPGIGDQLHGAQPELIRKASDSVKPNNDLGS